ncbi:S-layer homology domain-containing protein [Bacillus ndiopicus]|uniref:S-layer homology domain-containing protein n=1 Tax=Bacillus ndiopicus TaxID=1347368 RepID=UPI0006935118|nr:S-layer homology domain-containing protein [Bacillus ndiopicus]
MRKNKLFIVATAGVVATSSVAGIQAQAAATSFSDVKEKSSHYPAIMDLVQRGIIQGYPDGTFKPNEVVTYAQAAKIIAGVVGIEGTSEELLQLIGIVESPNQPVSRYSMATIIAQVLQLPASEGTIPFTDVTSEYKAAVAALFTNGITAGTSATTFSGERYVTRGQLATFIVRAERAKQTAPKITGTTLMIQDIQNGELLTDDKKWPIGGNAKEILNAKNATALTGAKLDVIVVNGEIAEVLAIDLNTSGESEKHVILDGGNASVDNVVVNADFVELKNITIAADLRVAGKTSNIVLDKVTVQGQVFLEEIEAPKTASLTKVATQFYTDGVNLHITNGYVPAIISNAANATIRSNTHIPYIYPGQSLVVDAPGVGFMDMQPWMYPEQIVGGTAPIDLLSLNADIVQSLLDNVRKIQEENEKFIQGLKDANNLDSDPTAQAIRSQLEKIIASIMQNEEQNNRLSQEQLRALLEKEMRNLPNLPQQSPEELNKIYDSQINNMLQERVMRERQQQQQRLQELERQKQEQLLNMQEKLAQRQSRARLQGSLEINNVLLPSEANASLTLGEDVTIGNITTNMTHEQLRERVNAHPGQIGTLTMANGQQSPFNSTLPSNNNSDSGSGNTGGTTPRLPKLETASLEAMIKKANERRASIEEAAATEPIAVNGDVIPYTQKWMPQSVVDALDTAIIEAEKMVKDAKGATTANQRVASLTNIQSRLALTQPEITQMVEKLEKLISMQSIEGLKEKKWLYDTLNGKEIDAEAIPPSIPDDIELPPEFNDISEEELRSIGVIYQILNQRAILENMPHVEFDSIFEVMLEEMRNKEVIQITDTQIIISLFEGLNFTDPTTQQSVSLVDELIAKIAITQGVRNAAITGATYTITDSIITGMTLNYIGGIDALSGEEELELQFGNDRAPISASIIGVSDTEIHLGGFEMHPDDRPSMLQGIALPGYEFYGFPMSIQLPAVKQINVLSAMFSPVEPGKLPNKLILFTYSNNLVDLIGKELNLDFGVGTSTIGNVLLDDAQGQIRVQVELDNDSPIPTELHAITVEGYQFNYQFNLPSPMPILPPPLLPPEIPQT